MSEHCGCRALNLDELIERIKEMQADYKVKPASFDESACRYPAALEAIRRLRGVYTIVIQDIRNSDAFPEASKREWCRVMEENLKETEQWEGK